MTPGAPPSQAALADRAAIADVLHAYAHRVDTRDWEGLRELFTPEAVLDYRAATGPRGGRDEVLGWVAAMLDAAVLVSQHLVGNFRIAVSGDTATAALELFNPMLVPSDGERPSLFLLSGHYEDLFVRTPEGWRIAERVHTTTWSAGPLPATLSVPGVA